MTRLRYVLEYAFLRAVVFFLGALPPSAASSLGGMIGRTIGPALAASRKARANLSRAMPDLPEAEKNSILKGMWDNLGRVVAEYPHLAVLAKTRTEIINGHILAEAQKKGKGAIFISGHIGNWEINAAACLIKLGTQIDLGYRAPNNPYVDRLLVRLRDLGGRLKFFPKSRHGGRSMIDALKAGGILGLLIDQKYREGIPAPFFGRAAMTNPFFAVMALKHGVPIIPVRCERVDGAQFRITLFEPIPTEGKTVEHLVADANAILEDWIRARPSEWLWLHRRWKD